MLGSAIKFTLDLRKSAARPVARAGSSVLSPVQATRGGGALPSAAQAKLTAFRSRLFATSSAPCGPYGFASAADDVEASFRKLGAGETGATALPFGNCRESFARMKRAGHMGSHECVRRMSSASAGLLGLHNSVRRMSTGSAGATGTSGEAAGAAAGDAAASHGAAAGGPALSQGGCPVELFEQSAGADEPSAAEDALRKVKELKGAKTVGALWSTIATADATQLCIRVRLPTPAPLFATDAAVANGAAWGRELRASMLFAKPQPIVGGESGARLLTLPGGVPWPQIGAAPMLLRPFYDDCYEGVMHSLESGSRFFVRGNAGTSKSVYGSYLMYKGAHANRTVIYISDKVETGLILHKDGRAGAFVKADFDRATLALRADPNAIVIYDGDGDGVVCKPPLCAASTVLITSPMRRRYKVFQREGGLDLVFPVFSRAEMLDLATSCFPEQLSSGSVGAKPAWEARYEFWGGIPRDVFARVDAASQELMTTELSSVTLERLADVLENPEIEDDTHISHHLLHLKPRGEQKDGTFVGGRLRESYILDRIELASPAVRKKVFKALQQSRTNRLLTLLAQPKETTSLAKFYGDMFQEHALAKLAAGGNFQAFKLAPKGSAAARTEENLVLRKSEEKLFDSIDDLADARPGGSSEDRIMVPKSGTFAAIDAVLPGQRLVNFTINTKHDILLYAKDGKEGLVQATRALGVPTSQRIPFYWALPRDRYISAVRAGTPFPVRLGNVGGSDSKTDSQALAKADGKGTGNHRVPLDPARVDGRGDCVASMANALPGNATAQAATATQPPPPASVKRGRGRPAGGAEDPTRLQYQGLVDQYALLVNFESFLQRKGSRSPHAPTPRT